MNTRTNYLKCWRNGNGILDSIIEIKYFYYLPLRGTRDPVLKALSPRDGRVYPFGARVTRAMPRSLESSSPDWARRTQKKVSTWIPFLCFYESARRDSNPRPRPWQGRAPPTEPLAHFTCPYLTDKYYYTI